MTQEEYQPHLSARGERHREISASTPILVSFITDCNVVVFVSRIFQNHLAADGMVGLTERVAKAKDGYFLGIFIQIDASTSNDINILVATSALDFGNHGFGGISMIRSASFARDKVLCAGDDCTSFSSSVGSTNR